MCKVHQCNKPVVNQQSLKVEMPPSDYIHRGRTEGSGRVRSKLIRLPPPPTLQLMLTGISIRKQGLALRWWFLLLFLEKKQRKKRLASRVGWRPHFPPCKLSNGKRHLAKIKKKTTTKQVS